jgi:hypothetical protein
MKGYLLFKPKILPCTLYSFDMIDALEVELAFRIISSLFFLVGGGMHVSIQ